MKTTNQYYRPRIIDRAISRNLHIFGAISIEGPKWCGKTWTARQFAKSETYFDRLNSTANDVEYQKIHIGAFLDGEHPKLLDEWQEYPAIWDAVRRICDEDKERGKFLLTGSATPLLGKVHHSGAGRICRMHMGTMTLYESGESDGYVSLKSLFDGVRLAPRHCPTFTLPQLAEVLVRGGWPEVLNMGNEDEARAISQSYIASILNADMSRIDGVRRNKNTMRKVLKSLARNESTMVGDYTIARDISEKHQASINTVIDYINTLDMLHLIELQPGFSPNIRSSSRVGSSAKRHLTDTSLVCAILNLNSERLLKDLHFMGFLYESLCDHDLRVYTNAIGGGLYHYRDSSGLEVDTIVELADGLYGAFEYKLGHNKIDEAAKTLLKFAQIVETPPQFLAIVCGTIDYAYQRPDGIYVFPITSLKD